MFMFLSKQEIVLDRHSLFNLFNLEVISVSRLLNSLIKLFFMHLLVDVREEHTNLQDSEESSNLTKTLNDAFWVEIVLDVDILNVKIYCGLL
jgi:hypothetical protein